MKNEKLRYLDNRESPTAQNESLHKMKATLCKNELRIKVGAPLSLKIIFFVFSLWTIAPKGYCFRIRVNIDKYILLSEFPKKEITKVAKNRNIQI